MNLRDIHDRIERRLAATGQSPSVASVRAGLSKDAIRNIRRALGAPERKGVSTRTLDLLAGSLRTTPEWLMRGTGVEQSDLNTHVQFAPLLSWVQAGQLNFAEVEAAEDQLRIPLTDLPVSDYIVLRVVGDSMNRVAPDASLIVVDIRVVDAVPRQFFVACFEDGSTTFKRFMDMPPRLEPYSTNPDHETIYPHGPWSFVGRVRRVIVDV